MPTTTASGAASPVTCTLIRAAALPSGFKTTRVHHVEAKVTLAAAGACNLEFRDDAVSIWRDHRELTAAGQAAFDWTFTLGKDSTGANPRVVLTSTGTPSAFTILVDFDNVA